MVNYHYHSENRVITQLFPYMVKGGYLVEVVVHDEKKFLLEVIDDHVI